MSLLDDEPQDEINVLLHASPLDLMKEPELLELKLEAAKVICSQCGKKATFKVIKAIGKECVTLRCGCRIRILYPPTDKRVYWLLREVTKDEHRNKFGKSNNSK